MAQAGSALPSSPGTYARASSGLVRSIGTTDAMWYGLNAITIAYIGFTLIDWVAYPGASGLKHKGINEFLFDKLK